METHKKMTMETHNKMTMETHNKMTMETHNNKMTMEDLDLLIDLLLDNPFSVHCHGCH